MKMPAFVLCILLLWCHASASAVLNLSHDPINLTTSVPPLTMLVMGRDHKLYYEAYNDASDVNQDGQINTHFEPTIIYYGYFDSFKCYRYAGDQFYPVSRATLNSVKAPECSGKWGGNYLNYLTTSRIDALRKVLYGGYRVQDTTSATVLERAYIPQDAHSWGKSYTSPAIDGFDLTRHSPLSLPSRGRQHLFANTTLLKTGNGRPLLRIASNVAYHIWEWLSIERPVAGNHVIGTDNKKVDISSAITDYTVRTAVCVPGLLEENCQAYRDGEQVVYKPVGLLQELGETDQMKFGLLTGSYGRNLSGGVLRKNIRSFQDEVKTNTGQFSSVNGIVKTLDKLRIMGFGADYSYNRSCGWIFTRDILNGECRDWGNPIAEMMYESIRYFVGKQQPTADYVYHGGDDDYLGLPKPNWDDPYAPQNNPWCAKPNMLVISDIYPSYDSDAIPGSAFSHFSGDLTPSLNVRALGDTIWQTEMGGAGKYYIGESRSDPVRDNAPTPKLVTSFGDIRGLTPEEPNKKGSYYAASVAYYGWLYGVHPNTPQQKKIHTFVVALTSPLPEIQIPVNGRVVRLVPFGKSVGGCAAIQPDRAHFQPTNTIVDFYVESLTATTGTFRINFEDAQQGADHDMDAIVRYQYRVNPDNTVTLILDSTYAAGCIIQHLGYSISGTTADGVYLEVRDRDTAADNDIPYYLDAPHTGKALPIHAERTFTPGDSQAAKLLKSPLWYAAKWGSFEDPDHTQRPDKPSKWDTNGDGNPDNYFLVTNAITLKKQLSQVLNNIANRSTSYTQVAMNSGQLASGSWIFQSVFDSHQWSGHLLAYPLDVVSGQVVKNGPAYAGAVWDAAAKLELQNWQNGRTVLSFNPKTQHAIPFLWQQLSESQKGYLRMNPVSRSIESETVGKHRWQYLRGDRQLEASRGGTLRNRAHILGDIINSSPVYVGKPAFMYPDTWPNQAAENDHPYSAFKQSAIADRPAMLYAGANDGMLHAFDATTGQERFAYVPSQVYPNLTQLTSPGYQHRAFVDAQVNVTDVFINGQWRSVLVGGLGRGGRGVYALDVTEPASVRESNPSKTVRWEFTSSPDLGYIYGRPAIVRLANGRWAAVFGNGYNNTADEPASQTGNAVLYIVDIATGQLIKAFDTHVGMQQDPKQLGRPNGLATPVVLDKNNNYIADTIYAGDLFGNVWKFDVHSLDPKDWKIALNGQPLFQARRQVQNQTFPQSITTRIAVGRVPNRPGAFQLFFGTGKYLEPSDKTNKALQTFYSIIDLNDAHPVSMDKLQAQYFTETQTLTPNGTVQDGRSSSLNTIASNQLGWYLDLRLGEPEGERVVSDPILRQEKLIFTTMIPKTDPCQAGGEGWLVELNAFSGRPLSYPPFDLDGDGAITDKDYSLQQKHHISAKKSSVGIISTPTIVSDRTREFKITSGSSGQLESTLEHPGNVRQGRVSWFQLK